MIDTNTDMRFMSNNFLVTGINSRSISSIASGYFASDLTTDERSRTFKFGGSYLIEANVNDRFSFNGNAYVVTPGLKLRSELVNELNALTGLGVFCSESTGYKFVFSKSTAFTLNLSATTFAIWDTIGYIPGVDLVATLEGSTYFARASSPRIHWPYEYIKYDLGYQAEIGFVGIIGDLTKELRIPEGAIITFQANNVDDFTAPPVDKVMTWTRQGLLNFIDDVVGSAWRYVLIKFEHPEGPYDSEIGYLYVGDYSTFNNRNISVGIELDFVDTSIKSNSDDGQEYTNEKTEYRLFRGLAVGLATPEHVTFMNRLFSLKKTTRPFFASLDPKLIISQTIDEQTMFCRFSSEPVKRHLLYKFYDLGFELKEVI